MKLPFLGDADKIGASCILIEMDGHRVPVDSEIRMGASPSAHLPNFSALDEFGPQDQVLVTYTHTDHTGALPVLVEGLPPDVPIRMTAPTAVITRVLLGDDLKITPDAYQAQGAPRLFVAEERAVVHVLQTPEPDEQSALQRTFLEITGFQIAWETR